jgi:DNA-binding transcriptional MocR family regulator
MPPPAKRINLLRGWPSPDLLPANILSAATQRILSTRSIYTPILEYGPSHGHPTLRTGLAQWLGHHYHVEPDVNRICVTGGASQSIANILLSFTDPAYTKAIWMIAPCYYLACGIFEDAGFSGRLRATPEDEEGVDIEALEAKISALEKQEENDSSKQVNSTPSFFRWFGIDANASFLTALTCHSCSSLRVSTASSTNMSYMRYRRARIHRGKPCLCEDANSSSN